MRLIDAKRLEAHIKEAFRENPVVMGIMLRWIRKQPTADVAPVVRCRECRHFREYITGGTVCTKDAELLGGREVGMRATGKDDFCSYGERKDNDEF